MRRFVLLLLPALLGAQSLKDFEKKVTGFTLANGLHFIIIERHEAPVVSFHTSVNVGSVDDPSGETGIAHMFEHMAFKGTQTIGTKNWPEEKKALDAIEVVYDQLDQEKRKGFHSDPKKIEALQAELKKAIEHADSLVEENEFDRIVESNGGVGLNAGTAEDSTDYFYSFPSNKIELWFLLESERFLQPVFREFYKERDVVREERRMRVESSPQGKLVEALLATAFEAHPYRNMPGGWASDIDNFRRPEAEAFYKIYYTPNNITIGIAGDVNPAEARRMAERYFGRLPRGPLPPLVRTVEPKQEGEKQSPWPRRRSRFWRSPISAPINTRPMTPRSTCSAMYSRRAAPASFIKKWFAIKRLLSPSARRPLSPAENIRRCFSSMLSPARATASRRTKKRCTPSSTGSKKSQ